MEGKKTGIQLIAEERERQMKEEGYSVEDDLRYNLHDDLAWAAETYIRSSMGIEASEAARLWPWDRASFKPKNAIRDLARAGALVAAALDVLIAKEEQNHA